MFNLNERIAEWRRQMLAAGIATPVPLNELESHLLDDVEQRMRSGLSAQQAFEAAVQGIGQAAVLECEFDKVGVTKRAQARAKHAILTLAGIPNHYLSTPMNTPPSNIEPGWATYLKATASLVPAVFLWALSVVFVMPKLQQICSSAVGAGDASFWKVTHFNFGIMSLFHDYGIFIAGTIILMLILLEWRSSKWPRYRRTAVGLGAFLLNSVVLISIFMMVVTAMVVASVLFHPSK
jgi:hypothetical protein